MTVNPVTLDKIEPVVIKNMEHRIVDRIVHEINGAKLNKDNKYRENNFNYRKQEYAAERFSYFLSKYNIKLEYNIDKKRKKVKIRFKDESGAILMETEVDSVEEIFKNISNDTGKIIDLKG